MSALLLATLLLPLGGALLLLFVPREEEGLARGVGITVSLLAFVASLPLALRFPPGAAGAVAVTDVAWIPGLGARFTIGVDGISLWLVLLTTFLTPLVLVSATRAIQKRVKEFVIAFLVLEVGMLGAFVALDLLLFYVMWEVMLVPMYLLIGVWGGERRIYAAFKFVLYTLVGSVLMLAAIIYLYVAHIRAGGAPTFSLAELLKLQLDRGAQLLCFAAFALAFAIKVPLFPLHTWLPDAHVEAPTAASVILAGVLLKLGVYGFLRFALPLFPHAAHAAAPLLATLAVIGVVYGALVAFAQTDAKKLVAYSSVSHLGFAVLGLLALNLQGLEGALFVMLSHGLTTGGLFLAIGVLYERRHTRRLVDFGGVARAMPIFAGLLLIITLGSAGLPGLSGFVGEFLALIGLWDAGGGVGAPHVLFPAAALTAVAGLGVILGAVYLLFLYQKLMLGPITVEENRRLPDLGARELAVFVPIVLAIFLLGLYPRPILRTAAPALRRTIAAYNAKLREPAQTTHLIPPERLGVGPQDALLDALVEGIMAPPRDSGCGGAP